MYVKLKLLFRKIVYYIAKYNTLQGQIQDFKLGGGVNLEKLLRAEGGAKIFGVFRVKNHDFTPKNQIFSIAEGGAKIVEVFRVKNHDFTPKNHIFPMLGGVPLDPPLHCIYINVLKRILYLFNNSPKHVKEHEYELYVAIMSESNFPLLLFLPGYNQLLNTC